MHLRMIQLMTQLRKVWPPISCAFPIICFLFLPFAAQLTPAQDRQRVKVPDEIVRQWMNDEDVKSAKYTTERLAHELYAETVDLNNDGKPEFIVSAGCSPTGN